MDVPLFERRQIENEMIFRRANENVSIVLDEIDAKHIADGNGDLVRTDDPLLHFRCECSDEECNLRIPIKLSVYEKIHKDRDAFIIRPNHQVTAIEKVVYSDNNYSIVEKNNTVAEPGDTLNTTPIHNV